MNKYLDSIGLSYLWGKIKYTFATKTEVSSEYNTLQGAINALQTSVAALTGLDSTNFGGFSIKSTEADAISNIATLYTANGYTDELLWYMAGTSLSSVKAYRYNGSGTPTAISSDSYNCVDFSGLIVDVSTLSQNLAALDYKINNHTADISNYENTDLSISDDFGNVLCKFIGGHIKTANFNSENTYKKYEVDNLIDNVLQDIHIEDYNALTFAICDGNGNVIFEIDKGHIKTKNFDSRDKINIFRQTKLDKPHCICHGYGASTGTANTLPYFRAAVAKGYQFFECDAVSTSDGVAVCTHSYSSYTVKNRNTGEQETIQISSLTYDELIADYTWPDGTEILKTKDLIYYLCYVKKYPLWVDGQGIDDTIRKDLSSYACSLGVGEYVFHERNVVFNDIPISNCIISGTLNNMIAFANTYKNASNNIIFHIPSTLTNEEVKQYTNAAHSVDCYACSYTFNSVDKVRDYMMNGTDFIITSGITDNQI